MGSALQSTNRMRLEKNGDVEYLNLEDRTRIQAYEAHGGGLRGEYITSHINSLAATVQYHQNVAKEHGEEYVRNVEVTYVAHDITRLSKYGNGHTEEIGGIPFAFRFVTFTDLLVEAGGINTVCGRIELYADLVHSRISRLPDAYSQKKRYCEIIGH